MITIFLKYIFIGDLKDKDVKKRQYLLMEWKVVSWHLGIDLVGGRISLMRVWSSNWKWAASWFYSKRS